MKFIKKINATKKEINRAKQEQAATAIQRGILFFPLLKVTQLFIFIIVILLAFIAGSVISKLGLFSQSAKSENVTIVEGIQELATLATAEAMVTTVMKEEDNKLFGQEISMDIPGTKRTIFLVVPATVIAGVDLQSITEQDIQIDEKTKKLTITIPHAEIIQDPSIQMDKIQTFSDEELFRSDVDWNEGYQLANEAKTKIIEEAKTLGILKKAEQGAIKVLTNFLTNLGYDVTVKFS